MPRGFDSRLPLADWNPLANKLNLDTAGVLETDLLAEFEKALEVFFNMMIQAFDEFTGFDLSAFIPLIDGDLQGLVQLFGDLTPAHFNIPDAIATFWNLVIINAAFLPRLPMIMTDQLPELLTGFATGAGSLPLLEQLITASGGTGSDLAAFGALFTGLSLAVTEITGLGTGVEAWLASGGTLPGATSLGVSQLSGLAAGMGTWLASAGAIPGSASLGLGQLSGLASGIGTWLANGGSLPGSASLGISQLSGLATGVESWLAGGGALPTGATATISQILTLPGQLSTMFSPFNPPQVIGTGQVTSVTQNLLINPTFATPDSMAGELVWTWDAAQNRCCPTQFRLSLAIRSTLRRTRSGAAWSTPGRQSH
jgi:hypothetical protein